MNKQRLKKLKKELAEKNLDAIFISNPENIFYLSGVQCFIYSFVQTTFDPEIFILITKNKNYIMADPRHLENIRAVEGFTTVSLPYPTTPKNLAELLNKLGKNSARMGFEEDNFIYSELKELKKSLSAQTIDASKIVKSLRLTKDSKEISLLKKAAKVTGDGFEYALSVLKKGMTEKQLAAEITRFFQENADGNSFSPIVAFGAGSAIPHYENSDKRISGEGALLIDLGCKYKGYCGDMTRTVYVGKAPEKFKKMYSAVLGAQENCLKNVRSGMTAREADELARNSFEPGLRKYFTHGTGHGLGIAIHEDPRIRSNDGVLTDGMVFSVEPGLYENGFGGVRIEDIVYMQNGKAVNITPTPKKLLEIRLKG